MNTVARRSFPSRIQLPSPQNGLVNGWNDFIMPATWLYRFIVFGFTNIPLADVLGVQVLINNTVIWDFASGTDLNLMNMYDGNIGMTGSNLGDGVLYLPLFFMRPRLSGKAMQLETGLNCGVAGRGIPAISSFKVRMQLQNIGGGEQIIPWGYVEDPVESDEGPGSIRRIVGTQYNIGGAVNSFQINDLPRGTEQFALLNRVLAMPRTVASVDAMRVLLNATQISMPGYCVNNYFNLVQNIVHVADPGANRGLLVFDSTDLGFGDEPIPVADPRVPFRVELDTNQASIVQLYTDLIGNLGLAQGPQVFAAPGRQ